MFNGSVTFTGSVTFVDRASIGLVADMVCRFACPVTVNNPGKDYCMFWSGGVAFARRPQVTFEQPFTGRLFWHCGNCYNDIRFLSLGNAPGTFVNNDGVTCMLDDQFDEATQFVMGGSMYLDLNGHSQTLTKFWGSAGTLTNTAPTGAKLALNYGGQAGNLAATAILNYYKGKVAGPLDFEWAPESSWSAAMAAARCSSSAECCPQGRPLVLGAHLHFSPIAERNSDGWQKGFTNVTPGAPHDSAAGKWQICF